eukprot:jgi/Ulvmu1/12596/UM092_0026.1
MCAAARQSPKTSAAAAASRCLRWTAACRQSTSAFRHWMWGIAIPPLDVGLPPLAITESDYDFANVNCAWTTNTIDGQTSDGTCLPANLNAAELPEYLSFVATVQECVGFQAGTATTFQGCDTGAPMDECTEVSFDDLPGAAFCFPTSFTDSETTAEDFAPLSAAFAECSEAQPAPAECRQIRTDYWTIMGCATCGGFEQDLAEGVDACGGIAATQATCSSGSGMLPPVDIGVPPIDVSVPPLDVGIPPIDVSLPPLDVGMSPLDVGIPPLDIGVPPLDEGVDGSLPPLAVTDGDTGIADGPNSNNVVNESISVTVDGDGVTVVGGDGDIAPQPGVIVIGDEEPGAPPAGDTSAPREFNVGLTDDDYEYVGLPPEEGEGDYDLPTMQDDGVESPLGDGDGAAVPLGDDVAVPPGDVTAVPLDDAGTEDDAGTDDGGAGDGDATTPVGLIDIADETDAAHVRAGARAVLSAAAAVVAAVVMLL